MSTEPDAKKFQRRLDARFDHKRVQKALIGSAIITLALYLIPFGRFVAYPMMLLSTMAHEMGHGFAAELMGGTFHKFEMFSNGSGVATSSGVAHGWRDAMVSAGGLIGPALLAGLAFIFVRGPKRSRALVGLLGLVALASTVLVVRNVFGWVFVGAVAAVLLFVAFRRPSEDSQLVLAFLAVQLAVSVFSRGDYLFTEVANTTRGPMPSDVAQMANALGGPYWLWGGLCGAISVLVLGLGLWWALRTPKAAGWPAR